MSSVRFEWNGEQVSGELRQAAARGLFLGGELVLQDSNTRVPLDEGPLERSGTASVDEGTLTAAVSYDTPYAVRQHEDMTYRHAPGRTAKYLEHALNSNADDVMELVAAQLRRALR